MPLFRVPLRTEDRQPILALLTRRKDLAVAVRLRGRHDEAATERGVGLEVRRRDAEGVRVHGDGAAGEARAHVRRRAPQRRRVRRGRPGHRQRQILGVEAARQHRAVRVGAEDRDELVAEAGAPQRPGLTRRVRRNALVEDEARRRAVLGEGYAVGLEEGRGAAGEERAVDLAQKRERRRRRRVEEDGHDARAAGLEELHVGCGEETRAVGLRVGRIGHREDANDWLRVFRVLGSGERSGERRRRELEQLSRHLDCSNSLCSRRLNEEPLIRGGDT